MRISIPVSVIRTVCSACADRLLSAEIAVQPSSKMMSFSEPSETMGSTVNVIPGSIIGWFNAGLVSNTFWYVNFFSTPSEYPFGGFLFSVLKSLYRTKELILVSWQVVINSPSWQIQEKQDTEIALVGRPGTTGLGHGKRLGARGSRSRSRGR